MSRSRSVPWVPRAHVGDGLDPRLRGVEADLPPPLLLVPALALDGVALSLGRGRFWFGPLTGIVFALTFFGTEYVWTWMVVGHAWLTDRLLPGIAWSVPAGAFSGLLGDHLGRLLRRVVARP
jgi:hypothetical protein